MKDCPNCNEEVIDNFEVCWNCNYSFTEKQVIHLDEQRNSKRQIDCLRCHVPLLYSGKYRFHEGANMGLFGNLFEAFVNRESFDLHVCPKCGKVEFFTPEQ